MAIATGVPEVPYWSHTIRRRAWYYNGMENQEINNRLVAIESDIKAIPKIQAELKVMEGMSNLKEDVSDLKEVQKRLEYAVAEIQAGQAEVSGMLKLLVALPERVEKHGQRISWLWPYGLITVVLVSIWAIGTDAGWINWLYGLITAALLFAGAYKLVPSDGGRSKVP